MKVQILGMNVQEGPKGELFQFPRYHDNLLKYPPKGVEYVLARPPKAYGVAKKVFNLEKAAKTVNRVVGVDLRAKYHSSLVDVDVDFLHCSACLPQDTDKPYVVDFEDPYNIVRRIDYEELSVRLLEAFGSGQCKAVFPWSRAAYAALQGLLGTVYEYPERRDVLNRIYGKTFIQPPALELPGKQRMHVERDDVNILFIGFDYKRKGGPEAVQAFTSLRNLYKDITLTLITKTKPGRLPAGVEYVPPQPREKLESYYLNADIYWMPTRHDVYGLTALEAASYGLPIIASNQYAMPDIVNDGVNGFLSGLWQYWYYTDEARRYTPHPSQTDESFNTRDDVLSIGLHSLTQPLIESAELRETMGDNAREKFQGPNGLNSIERGNTILRRAYGL